MASKQIIETKGWTHITADRARVLDPGLLLEFLGPVQESRGIVPDRVRDHRAAKRPRPRRRVRSRRCRAAGARGRGRRRDERRLESGGRRRRRGARRRNEHTRGSARRSAGSSLAQRRRDGSRDPHGARESCPCERVDGRERKKVETLPSLSRTCGEFSAGHSPLTDSPLG